MPADVEQVRFDTALGFLRVVEQQGRVTLAAERNAQIDILLHQIRALAVDLVGPYGTPAALDTAGKPIPGPGFAIGPPTVPGTLFDIGPGHYWVRGRLCALDPPVDPQHPTSYTTQADYSTPDPPTTGTHLAYLDVWERPMSAAEDPTLLEPALGGPDSCSRTKLVFQVRLHDLTTFVDPAKPDQQLKVDATRDAVVAAWDAIEANLGRLVDGGRLSARVDATPRSTTPCLAAPTAGYTGEENQLIRVEVYDGGPGKTATFTWAFDNASVEHRLVRVNGTRVVFDLPPRDIRKGFEQDVRVEVLSDEQLARGERGLLTAVDRVEDDGDEYELVLKDPVTFLRDGTDGRWALLRRWDTTGPDVVKGARPVVEGKPLDLADGVQITFAPPPTGGPPWIYHPGDHWTIPVRTATGDVIWPRDAQGPVARPPEGVEHSFAPLALVAPGAPNPFTDLREFFAPLAKTLP
jgi:Family of unknown function (DUF6519)